MLVWQDAVFRLFNEAWRLEDSAQPSGVTAPLLAEAVVNGYVANLVLGVSRLTDKADYGKSGARNVVSLRRLVDEIKGKRDLITRENFVCYDGLVYDVNTIPPPSQRGCRGRSNFRPPPRHTPQAPITYHPKANLVVRV